MAVKFTPIPGGEINVYSGPWVEIVGTKDQSLTLIIKYGSGWTPELQRVFTEITFSAIIEYRFYYSSFGYRDFPELYWPEPYPGLVEIENSPYIENMLSKNRYSTKLGQRMGGVIKESDVHHFTIDFDDYGTFHILAIGVSIRHYTE